ncbi:Fur family transcriptional regulator [Thiohalobacter sp. IOR34]|uniref:Fur family transcriptional regulator n=1 Tax=Thiohalobacter sp. IOR34 TaxID=3057176 RepID=UPI0025AF887D|nr:Fur family transcriptional regulator [Thiohalobacter sp. IOR34]WJW75082.1 Fur family transcriptional regulator [Thiohalobacter sp. IOR34]
MSKRPPRQPLDPSQVVELLEAHHIQPTQQRVQIAQVLFARDQHLSADDVMSQVNAGSTRVSKATVYNTLGLFARKGLIREVIVDPSRVFYDPNTDEHHHFYNVDTGTLMDIDADEFVLQALPQAPEGMVAEGIDIIVRVRNA